MKVNDCWQGKTQGAHTSGESGLFEGKMLKSLTIVKLYRGMFKLKVEIYLNLPQWLCLVVSVALNVEFERFCGFCVVCYYTL